MSQAADRKAKTLSGPYGEADLDGERLGLEEARCSYPPEHPLESDISELKDALREQLASYEPEPALGDTDEPQTEVYTLVVPPTADPEELLPSTIEEAIRQVIDQVPRAHTASELPPAAYAARPVKTAATTDPLELDGDAEQNESTSAADTEPVR